MAFEVVSALTTGVGVSVLEPLVSFVILEIHDELPVPFPVPEVVTGYVSRDYQVYGTGLVGSHDHLMRGNGNHFEISVKEIVYLL